MKVYEAAVAAALQEGGISAKERSLLIRLRDSLGIPESDAADIEQELQAQVLQTLPCIFRDKKTAPGAGFFLDLYYAF